MSRLVQKIEFRIIRNRLIGTSKWILIWSVRKDSNLRHLLSKRSSLPDWPTYSYLLVLQFLSVALSTALEYRFLISFDTE